MQGELRTMTPDQLRKWATNLEVEWFNGRIDRIYPPMHIEQLLAHAAALERVKVLEEALRKYGAHSDSCGDMDAYNGAEQRSCNCGLDAALAQKEEP